VLGCWRRTSSGSGLSSEERGSRGVVANCGSAMALAATFALRVDICEIGVGQVGLKGVR